MDIFKKATTYKMYTTSACLILDANSNLTTSCSTANRSCSLFAVIYSICAV